MHVGSDAIRTVQKSPVGPVAETAVGDGVESLWDAERERVVERSSGQPEAALTEDAFRGEALALLRSGRAQVTEGRETLRIAEGNRAYIVDGDDYTPIALRTRGTSGGTVLRFKVYESLPLNAETEKLLSIAAQHPGAPVVRDAAAYDAAAEALRERLSGQLLEDPVGIELAPPVRAAVDQHVVARAQVHRQVALDRIPLVVGADQLVELLERPPLGDRAPAAREARAVAAALGAQARRRPRRGGGARAGCRSRSRSAAPSSAAGRRPSGSPRASAATGGRARRSAGPRCEGPRDGRR